VLGTHFLECDERALAAIPAFSEVPREVGVLVVPSVPVAADLPRVSKKVGAIRYVPAHFTHYCIELPRTFDEYMAGLSGKARHEMMRKVRRFAAFSGGR